MRKLHKVQWYINSKPLMVGSWIFQGSFPLQKGSFQPNFSKIWDDHHGNLKNIGWFDLERPCDMRLQYGSRKGLSTCDNSLDSGFVYITNFCVRLLHEIWSGVISQDQVEVGWTQIRNPTLKTLCSYSTEPWWPPSLLLVCVCLWLPYLAFSVTQIPPFFWS